MVVLVVEDEPLVRELVVEILRRAGLRVLGVESAERALLMVGGVPQLLVTDVNLGAGMNGFELLAQARVRWPTTSYIIMTANPDLMVGRTLASDERFVPKPFRSAQLIDAAEELMANSVRRHP
jgi:CheY-like chemotaxis protein